MGKTEEERDEVNIRSFLGKMIFSEKKFKTCRVLSGGEKNALYVVTNDDGKSQCFNAG
jgi:ATPase subunit of ABC transporter with duplicated ATPase domains